MTGLDKDDRLMVALGLGIWVAITLISIVAAVAGHWEPLLGGWVTWTCICAAVWFGVLRPERKR